MAGYRLEQFDRRVAAVGDGDQLPLGQPASEQDQQLARPVGQLLVAVPALPGEALGWRQRRHEG